MDIDEVKQILENPKCPKLKEMIQLSARKSILTERRLGQFLFPLIEVGYPWPAFDESIPATND
ncbi:MAG: hypothetical protein HDR44_00515 [Allobaculum sp.]|nr:hypothetical protein [Allobaculum sp.]